MYTSIVIIYVCVGGGGVAFLYILTFYIKTFLKDNFILMTSGPGVKTSHLQSEWKTLLELINPRPTGIFL